MGTRKSFRHTSSYYGTLIGNVCWKSNPLASVAYDHRKWPKRNELEKFTSSINIFITKSDRATITIKHEQDITGCLSFAIIAFIFV